MKHPMRIEKYVTPQIEIIDCAVEQGFANTSVVQSGVFNPWDNVDYDGGFLE